MANIAIKNNFKVGTKVRVYCPYGSFEYEDTVTAVSPKGMSISVGESKYNDRNFYPLKLSPFRRLLPLVSHVHHF